MAAMMDEKDVQHLQTLAFSLEQHLAQLRKRKRHQLIGTTQMASNIDCPISLNVHVPPENQRLWDLIVKNEPLLGLSLLYLVLSKVSQEVFPIRSRNLLSSIWRNKYCLLGRP
jgi:hypothetical protein